MSTQAKMPRIIPAKELKAGHTVKLSDGRFLKVMSPDAQHATGLHPEPGAAFYRELWGPSGIERRFGCTPWLTLPASKEFAGLFEVVRVQSPDGHDKASCRHSAAAETLS